MTQSSHRQLINRYLEHVAQELSDLPAAERDEILTDLESHIMESVGSLDNSTEADVRNALERLGHPQDVAREARGEPAEPTIEPASDSLHDHAKTPGALEVAAIILTALFWPIGVLLAWLSERWLTRDKIIATVIPFTSTLLLGAIIVGGMVAYSTDDGVTYVMEQTEPAGPVFPADPQEGSAPPPEPRSPAGISESPQSGGELGRLIVVLGFLAGAVAGPFIAAVYLAIRLQPRTHRHSAPHQRADHGVPVRGHS